MWWVLWVLAILLALFCFVDVWYFLRAAAVILRAWFQPPVWDITAEQVLTGRVTPHDIDMCHMNNARYLRECDFARFSLYMRNGVFKAVRALKASMVVGATTIRYRRALCIGEGYELRSRIVTWDDKAFFLEQRFVSTKDGLVCAVMYCKQSVIRSTRFCSTCAKERWSALSFQRIFSTGSTSSLPAARPSGLRAAWRRRTNKTFHGQILKVASCESACLQAQEESLLLFRISSLKHTCACTLYNKLYLNSNICRYETLDNSTLHYSERLAVMVKIIIIKY
uniref:Protein THEM6 n=1 Tax=Neolamprologus brichardi TaxID=32507 RepID=A0A3Q4GUU0_NEOBR